MCPQLTIGSAYRDLESKLQALKFSHHLECLSLCFLCATKHLFNWLCPSVGWSVGWSVTHSFDAPHRRTYWPTWPCSFSFSVSFSFSFSFSFSSSSPRYDSISNQTIDLFVLPFFSWLLWTKPLCSLVKRRPIISSYINVYKYFIQDQKYWR